MTAPTVETTKFVHEEDGVIGMIVDDSGKIVGREHYKDHVASDGSKQRVFISTEVDEDYRGKGLAGKLVKHSLDEAIGEGYRFVAVCPYARRWLDKHDDPRYKEARDTARPEHFQ